MKISQIHDEFSGIFRRLWLACLPQSKMVTIEYEDAMRAMAVAYSYSYLSYNPDRMATYILRWAATEAAYARLGLRTVGLWTAVEWINGGRECKLPLDSKREKGEKPLFYAQNYFDLFRVHGFVTPEDGPKLTAAA